MLEKRAMIALAGPIAQKVSNPRSFRNYHASADYKAAVDMALLVNGSAKQTEAWLKWLEIRTRGTLQAQRSIVEGLAEELLRATTLNGEQVQHLLRPVQPNSSRHTGEYVNMTMLDHGVAQIYVSLDRRTQGKNTYNISYVLALATKYGSPKKSETKYYHNGVETASSGK
jgi:hypothetical protein